MRLNFQENKPKTIIKYVEKKDYTILYTICAIVIIAIMIIIFINTYKNSKCNNIEDTLVQYAYEYASNNNLLNLNEGDSVTVSLNDVYNSGYSLKDKCMGSVKFTLVDGSIIKTFDITDCSYCTTDKRYGKNWKTSQSLSNSRLVDVEVKYNYYNADNFYSSWTEWYPSSYIDTILNPQYNIRLPLDSKYLPTIPSTSEVLSYDVEYSTYYSYRDQTWRWYKNPNNDYSTDWYSESPLGYQYKDSSTSMYTEWSEWSLNYPDIKDYREIKNTTGYRWYYLDSDKYKHYWNGGAYTPSQPNEEYSLYDDSAKMYSYRDETWRWYNGSPRGYFSSYTSTGTREYIYKDSLFSSYTEWSRWSNEQPEKFSYRTIKNDIYYRYRAFYRDVNYLVLDSYVSKEEFENIVKTSLDDFRSDTTKKISYKYTYLYK